MIAAPPPAKPPVAPGKKAVQLALALALLGFGAWQLYKAFHGGRFEIAYSCKPDVAGIKVTCDFTAQKGSGAACVDMTATCADGIHKTIICSGDLKEGQKVTRESAPIGPPFTLKSPPCKFEWHDRSEH